jgi:hypothetical protein
MVQTRNLNIDPVWYVAKMGLGKETEKPLGIANWVSKLKNLTPRLKLGYFNPPINTMKK